MDDEMIIIDRRDPPFFSLDNNVIDKRLGLESVAVYAYLVRHGHATQDEIMLHFGIEAHHVYNAVASLCTCGLVNVDMSELRYED